ncbi:MAG: LptF/LptG family permease, partial [Bdellovibrionales bacterium]|nr:LptF/LptG family permease [Bdellovibrionales bacterium]
MLMLSSLIVKEWFKSLIGAVVVLFLLITTTDLINGFLQGKEISRVFLEYLLKMPDLMGKMLPICCLVATLFSLNKLKAHSELISILAAGFSYRKIYLLIGFCASSVMFLQFYNLGFLEPIANSVKRQEIQKSKKSEGRYLTRSSIEGGKFWYKSQNYFASFTYFDRKHSKLKDFEIYYFNENHKSEKILISTDATYKSDGKWLLNNVTELTLLDDPTFPLQTQRPEQSLTLKEVPEDFGEFEADLTTLSFFKLYQFVKRLSKTGINVSEYQIILLNKIFLSFICLVFGLIPVSSIFNPNRRSSSFGKNVVQTLVITVAFWVLYSSSVAFGNSGSIPPWLATGVV